MLTSKAGATRLDLPHEPGQWIEVRLPAWPVLVSARNIRQRNAIDELSGWSEEGMRKARSSTEGASVSRVPDVADEYDWACILGASIVGWSYDAPVSPETISDLDEESARFVVRACVPVQRSEDDLKNGSSASTSSSTARRKP